MRRTKDVNGCASTFIRHPIKPIAPWWHTVVVLLPIAIGSVASAYQHGHPNLNLPGMSHRLSGYFTVLLEEWLGVVLVWLALRRAQLNIDSLVLGRWEHEPAG